jgi:hypothetical protein
MDTISVAEYLSASETDQLASPITVKEKQEFVFNFLSFFFFFLTSVHRRKPSAKAKYMLQAASVDVASGSDDWTPPPAKYFLSYFVFR